MFSPHDKQMLLSQLLTLVAEEHETLVSAHRASQKGATHEQARPENDKDTRALEQSYLARGQAERVIQLKTDLDLLSALVLREPGHDPSVVLSALVHCQDETGGESLYFLAPAGAGQTLTSSHGAVKVVTPRSPLGRALLGKRAHDEVEIGSPTGTRLLQVVWVG